MRTGKAKERLIRRREVQALTGIDAYLQSRMAGWRASAKRRGLSFEITRSEIKDLWLNQGGKCHFSGEQISIAPNKDQTLSIDRLDSKKGYIKDNIVLCTTLVNKMKQSMTTDEFLAMCHVIADLWLVKRTIRNK